MIVTDFSRAPLLIAVTIGPADPESTQQAIATWQALWQAGTAFAAVQVFVDDEATRQRGGECDLATWMAAQAATTHVQAWAVARVVLAPDAAVSAGAPSASAVPVQDFPDMLSALRWLRDTALAPRGHALSLEGTASAIAGLCWQADV